MKYLAILLVVLGCLAVPAVSEAGCKGGRCAVKRTLRPKKLRTLNFRLQRCWGRRCVEVTRDRKRSIQVKVTNCTSGRCKK